MPPFEPLLPASHAAQALKAGQISPQQWLAAQRQRIASLNPSLRAYLSQTDDGPPAEPATGSALWGLGFAIKDNIDLAGHVSRCGLAAYGAQPAKRDAPVVSALKAAGMVCLGRLNMHPMALGATNRNLDYGDCLNPLRPGYSPGGSSGGSAAAVAAGLCTVSLGTDTMGSVRLPAAYCGVVGFKPSHGLLSLQGVVPLSLLLDHVGVIARDVCDVRSAMAALAPDRHWGVAAADLTGLRLALPADLHALGVQADVALAFDQAAAILRRTQQVQTWARAPDAVQLGRYRRSGLLLCEAELHGRLAPLLESRSAELPPDLLAMMRYIEKKTSLDLGRALAEVGLAAEAAHRWFDEADFVVLPTAPQTAFDLREPAPANQADLTAMANMAGLPAITLALGCPPGQMPAGLQIIGRRGDDARLLAWAEQVQTLLGAA